MTMRGFTLVELVFVIVLMSILGVMATVRMPSVSLFKTQSFSGILLHDLNLTKALSMSKNQPYRMVIGASSYQIQDQTGAPVMHPETHASAIIYATGVSVTPTTTIVFDSLGKPYNSAGTVLSSTLNFTVTSEGVSRVVSVSPQTGFIQ